MDMQVEIALIGAFQMIVVAVVGGLFARSSKKQKESLDRAEIRAALRAEESRLSMKLMSASVNLGIATAAAVKDGHINGKMTNAVDEAEKTEQEYQDFIKAIASNQINK